jgi:hypothetical protein
MRSVVVYMNIDLEPLWVALSKKVWPGAQNESDVLVKLDVAMALINSVTLNICRQWTLKKVGQTEFLLPGAFSFMPGVREFH